MAAVAGRRAGVYPGDLNSGGGGNVVGRGVRGGVEVEVEVGVEAGLGLGLGLVLVVVLGLVLELKVVLEVVPSLQLVLLLLVAKGCAHSVLGLACVRRHDLAGSGPHVASDVFEDTENEVDGDSLPLI